MDVKVLFFARSRELAGAGEALLQLTDAADTAIFLEELYRKVSYQFFTVCFSILYLYTKHTPFYAVSIP